MIRLARPEDAEVILHLVRDAYSLYVARIGKPPGPMLDDYDQRIADGQVWMLEDEGRHVGLLVLEDLPGRALLLDNVAVAPSAQHKGYGRALVAFAEAEAHRRGHSKVLLYTHVLMTENLALYGRLGFREAGWVYEKGYERVYMAKATGGTT